MSTEFYNRNFRMPNSFNGSEDNNSKFSNYSMQFNNDRVNLTSSIDLGLNSTASFWVNSDALGSVILGEISYGNNYFIYIDGANIYVNITGVGLPFSHSMSTGQWYNIIIVREGNSIEVFQNNTSLGTQTGFGTSVNTKFNTIGAKPNGTFLFSGKLDHFAAFDYALSQAQITALYGSSSTGVGNPMAITNGRKPVAFYPLGDYSAYNGTEYLVPNSAVSDYVFEIIPQGDYINCGKGIGNSIGDNYTGGLTISGWINPNTTTSDDGVFQFGNFTGYEMALVLNASKFIFYNNGQKFAVSYTNPNNEWTNFALTFLPSSSVFYVNGVVSANWTYTDLDLNNLDFIIGSYYNAGFNLTGEVSNFSVFNTALPATGTESVASLYNYGTPPDISSYSGLQGWWKLDASATFDGSNWSIEDSSSNSNTGTSSGMTASNLVQSNLNILSPYSRYALDFDGSNDYIDCGSVSAIPSATELSVSFWANTDSTSQNQVVFGDNSSAPIFSFEYWGSLNRMYFEYGTGTFAYLTLTDVVTAGTWHNVVLVYNGSGASNTDKVKIYVDGVDKSSLLTYVPAVNGIPASLSASIGDFWIGNGQNYNQPFYGKLSNASIWNTALTSAQVTEIYNNGLPSNLKNHSSYSNLVSWWTLGENSSFNTNWTVIDEKGTNNGTSVNMAEDDLVNGVGTSGNGISSGMGGADNIIGEAPYSTSNALSYGMGADAKSTSVPS